MGGAASCFKSKVQEPQLEAPPLTPVSKAHIALSKLSVTDAKRFREDKDGYLRQYFKQWDVNGDGQLSLAEMAQLLEGCGAKFSTGELKKIMDAVDLDGNGYIELEELSSWLGLSPSIARYSEAIVSLYEDLVAKLENLPAGAQATKYEAVKSQAREDVRRRLIPLIDEVFANNDRDGNGVLDEDESVLMFQNFASQLMKTPNMIESMVGLVTCTSYADVISEVCERTVDRHGFDGTAAQRGSIECKSRFEVQKELVRRRQVLEEEEGREQISYRNAFKVIDANGDGCLQKEEVQDCLLPSCESDTCRQFLSALGLIATHEEMRVIAEEKLTLVLKDTELANKAAQQWEKMHPTKMHASCRRRSTSNDGLEGIPTTTERTTQKATVRRRKTVDW